MSKEGHTSSTSITKTVSRWQPIDHSSCGNLRHLDILDLRNNRLTTLPESLSSLHNLTFLDLRANRFVSLPPGIAELTKLEKLDLRWNKISSSLEALQSLERRG